MVQSIKDLIVEENRTQKCIIENQKIILEVQKIAIEEHNRRKEEHKEILRKL